MARTRDNLVEGPRVVRALTAAQAGESRQRRNLCGKHVNTALRSGTSLGALCYKPHSMKTLLTLLVLILLCGPAASQASEHAAVQSPAGAVASTAPEGADAARIAVESLHDVLLGCMKEADALGFQGRYDRILANLDETFDLPFMARVSIGAVWKELAEPQREDFIDLSRRLSASDYAGNFDGYGGESFETSAVEPAARGTLLVRTKLVRPDDDDVKFDYRLRMVGEDWRIIDVQLDGKISEMTLRRADYRSVIKRKGYPQLVEALEEKVEKLFKE